MTLLFELKCLSETSDNCPWNYTESTSGFLGNLTRYISVLLTNFASLVDLLSSFLEDTLRELKRMSTSGTLKRIINSRHNLQSLLDLKERIQCLEIDLLVGEIRSGFQIIKMVFR